MHISSLPSPYGIGSMGAQARAFVDFLASAGQSYWQILPICPTGFGDSPYQSYSTHAGNPYFIDLDDLANDGLLWPEEYMGRSWGDDPAAVDYGRLYELRYPVLRLACRRLADSPTEDYAAFCRENAFWLEDYALFMALKQAHGGAPWRAWEPTLRNREPEVLERARRALGADLDFWRAVQYLFFRQWRALKGYANGKGISIIGDLPIYVSEDGVDVWARRELFQVDGDGTPIEVAGVPPDGFTADGQLWGNPLFDWEAMEKDGYRWWIDRIRYQCAIYDVLRIDHFRGFDSYYAIPYGAANARGGQWRRGPGIALFRALEREAGKQRIIAEDLGYMTDSVRALLEESGFPGMKVLQFAFDSRDGSGEDYLPHNYPAHCVVYTGTHDNDTVLGWMEHARPADAAYAVEYLRLSREEGWHWGMMRAVWASVGELAVVTAQDVLGLGGEARMNTPSTVGNNWRWRALPGVFTHELAAKLRHETALYGRMQREG